MRLIKCRDQLFDTKFHNVVLCHNKRKALHHLKGVKKESVPEFDNPGNVPTFKMLDDLMDCE
jgi:hypothetical protein